MTRLINSNSSSSIVTKSILFLYFLNIVVRLYGITFPRWAWDEPYYFFGGVNIINFFSGLLHLEWRSNEIPEFFNVVGILNKYVCVIPAALGLIIEKTFNIHTAIPIGAYIARFFLGFIPNMLIVVYTQKIIKEIINNNFILICNLILFLFPFRLIETSIYAVADSLVTFFAVASVYYLIKFRNSSICKEKIKYLKTNAVFVCLAFSTKLNVGFFLGISFLIIIFYDLYKQKLNFSDTLLFLKKYVWLFSILFVLINMPYLFHLPDWIDSLSFHMDGRYAFLLKGHPLIYFYTIPAMGMGWGLLLISLAGLVYCLFTPQRKQLFPVYVFMLVFYLFLSTTYGATHNWHIPLMPFLILFASFCMYFLLVFFKKKLSPSLSLAAISIVLIAVCIIPAINIYQFKMNIVENSPTLDRLNTLFEKLPKNNWLLNRDEKIKSLTDFENSSVQYAIFSDDWFAIKSHPYPAFVMHYENFQKRTFGTDWLSIRDHVEKNWKLVSVIRPTFYTNWTTNTSINAIYYVYKKN